jgi:cytochrome P450
VNARRLDRAVYLRSHPFLFALLCATRRRPIVRLGRTVLVHGPGAYHEILTRVPLDRAAPGTTGGTAARAMGGALLFDQAGEEHRAARRSLSATLGTAGVARLRPLWREVLDRRLAQLPGPVDLVPLAQEVAGVTAAALTGSGADPLELASAAADAASAAAREHLPGIRPIGGRGLSLATRQAAARLTALLPDPLDAMLAVAAVNTTVAALPRAAAWCCRDGLWDRVTPELAAELLRLTAPTPILPRVAAASAAIDGHRVREGDRLILVARHAAESHRDAPAQPHAAHAVFGAGPHSCPGAHLARAQLTDVLAALAPHGPVIKQAKAARKTALPGYSCLVVVGAP